MNIFKGSKYFIHRDTEKDRERVKETRGRVKETRGRVKETERES
jgi:hypothetical protein